jgi:hypothetical protein
MARIPRSDIKLPLHHTIVKIKEVNGGGFYFLPAGKTAILRVFTPKKAIQKVS